MVPFVAALTGALGECQLRANRPRIATAVMAGTQARFDADTSLMADIALARMFFDFFLITEPNPVQVVRERREHPTDPDAPKDLLDRMLTVVDTKTGEMMTDGSIVDNVRSPLGVPQHLSDLDPSCSPSSSLVMRRPQVRSLP